MNLFQSIYHDIKHIQHKNKHNQIYNLTIETGNRRKYIKHRKIRKNPKRSLVILFRTNKLKEQMIYPARQKKTYASKNKHHRNHDQHKYWNIYPQILKRHLEFSIHRRKSKPRRQYKRNQHINNSKPVRLPKPAGCRHLFEELLRLCHNRSSLLIPVIYKLHKTTSYFCTLHFI